MNLSPTLLDVAGITTQDTVEDRSFLPTLLGQRFTEKKRPLFFPAERAESATGQSVYAVRLGPWKLLQSSPWQSMKLYHLESDPQEQNNIANQEPEKYQELLRLLMNHIQQGGRTPWQPWPGK